MALFVLGKTPCQICNRPLMKGDSVVSFSPFVANRRDLLYRFSDAAFHKACFEAEPLAEAAIRRSEDVRTRGGPANRRCAVCEQQINDPDDYFGVGFLTDDPGSLAFEFNYLTLHRSHFFQWERATNFRRAMETFLLLDAWEGPLIRFDPLPRWEVSASPRRTH
jgi:hypothetical protein